MIQIGNTTIDLSDPLVLAAGIAGLILLVRTLL